MRCERYDRDVTDGAAGGAMTRDLEAHLESCAACRERLAEGRALLGRVDQILAAHLDVEPSPALRRRVISCVAQAERARRRMARWAAAAALAAGLVIALMAGALGRRPSAMPLESSIAATVPGVPARGAVPPETPALRPSIPRAVVPEAPRVVRRGSPAAIARGAVVPEPEVLVPPGQDEALRRFMAGLREDAEAARPLLRASASVEDPVQPPPPIDIPVLASEPLADPADPLERSKS